MDQRFHESLLFFGPAGEKLGELGRRGEGPGEFSAITGIGWTADTLWVSDPSAGRLTRFSGPRGDSVVFTEVRTSPVPLRARPTRLNGLDIPGFAAVTVRGVYPGGDLLAELALPEVTDESEFAQTAGYVRLASDGSVQRVLARVHRQPEEVRVLWTSEARLAFGAPWVLDPSVAVAGDGRRIAVVSPKVDGEAPVQAFEVTMLDGVSGDTLYTRRHAFEATPIPSTVADSAIDDRAESIAVHDANFPDVDLVAKYRRDVVIPPIYPPFGTALLGLDGRLWIQKLEEGRSGTGSYIVLDDEGDLVGEVMLRAGVLAAEGDYVWRAVRDAYGVPSLIRYYVSWTEGG